MERLTPEEAEEATKARDSIMKMLEDIKPNTLDDLSLILDSVIERIGQAKSAAKELRSKGRTDEAKKLDNAYDAILRALFGGMDKKTAEQLNLVQVSAGPLWEFLAVLPKNFEAVTNENNELQWVAKTDRMEVVIQSLRRQFKGKLLVETYKIIDLFNSLHLMSRADGAEPTRILSFPVKYFAEMCGKKDLKQFRKTLGRALDSLMGTKVVYKDKDGIPWAGRILNSYAERIGSTISLRFSAELGEYLDNANTKTFCHPAFFRIDGNHSGAYLLAKGMYRHYNIDHNHIVGTATKLKIKTLLSYTELPKLKEIGRRSWREAIQEPFFNMIEYLKKIGLLEEFNYLEITKQPNGTTLFRTINGDSEKNDLENDAKKWMETTAEYKFSGAIDHSERIARKQERAKLEAKKESEKKSGRKAQAKKHEQGGKLHKQQRNKATFCK